MMSQTIARINDVKSVGRRSSVMANAYLVPLSGGDPIPLVKDSIILGRRPESDIRLEVPNISGRHAELRLHRGNWYVIDLGSANGTKVNGDRVKKKKLASGDEVVFARTNRFKVEFDALAAVHAAKPKSNPAADEAWEKSRRNRATEKLPVEKLAAGNDDFDDFFEDEIETDSGFKQSLLEKAGLSKSSKPEIDDVLDGDLDALEELEGLIDEPTSKPRKLDE